MSVEKETIIDPYEDDYNEKVKEALYEWKIELEKDCYRLNFESLSERLEENGILISAQLLRRMFNPDSDYKVPLKELVAVTQILGIPLNIVCKPFSFSNINLETSGILKRRKTKKEEGIEYFFDLFYDGEFYAYYFKQKHLDSISLNGQTPIEGMEIEEARIQINNTDNCTLLELEELTPHRDFYNKEELSRFILEGQLYTIRSKMAYSFIKDPEARRTITLMFNYKSYSKDIMFYRTAAMLTISTNEKQTPLFQKMAIFKERQNLNDPKESDVIRGILALNSNPIMIGAEVFDEMCKNDKILEKIKEIQNPKSRSYYTFNEADLRNLPIPCQSEERMKTILKLRQHSCFPAHEIVSEPEYFGEFIKNYQQAQLEKRDRFDTDLMKK